MACRFGSIKEALVKRRPVYFLAILFFLADLASGQLPDLIPREVFIKPQKLKTNPQLDPDGKRLAYIGFTDKGVPNIFIRPETGSVQAVAFNYLIPEWKVLDPGIQKDFEILEKMNLGVIQVLSRTPDDRKWIVQFISDVRPPAYYVYNRDAKEARLLFEDQSDFGTFRFSPLQPVVIRARDGRASLLIAHGQNDPRVKISEPEQIVKAMRAKKIPVTFVVYPDEGHGLGRPENQLDLFGRIEEFLGKNLGARFEPWNKVEGSSTELR
jgi:alpha-beta hydrolase superfamily lysophospholipase